MIGGVMSEFGTKRTSGNVRPMSAFGGQADIPPQDRDVAPGDIPIERPTVFEFALNLRIAKYLDLIVPSAMLTRADEVIE